MKIINCIEFTEKELSEFMSCLCSKLYNSPDIRAKLGFDKFYRLEMDFKLCGQGSIGYDNVSIKVEE